MEAKAKKRQIELFLYKSPATGERLFLLLKRIPEKGGFWQPITGGAEMQEEIVDCLKREAREETGVYQINEVIDTKYQFDFSDHGHDYTEYVYGGEVGTSQEITLSREHTEYRWVTAAEAFSLLKWPGNKEGLTRLLERLNVKDSQM